MATPTLTYGQRTLRAVASGTTAFTVLPPAATVSDHTRVIVIKQTAASVTWTVGSSFTAGPTLTTTSDDGRLRIYTLAGVSSGTVSLTPSAGVDAVIDTFMVDGPLAVSVVGTANLAYSQYVAAPSITPTNSTSLWVQVVAGARYPRRFALASGVTAVSSLVNHGYVGALAIGSVAATNSATGAGTNWEFLDADTGASGPSYTAAPIAISLAFSPSSAGGIGTAPTFTTGTKGEATGSQSSIAVTLATAAAGNTHGIAVSWKPATTALTTLPAGFTLVEAGELAGDIGKCALLLATRAGAFTSASVSLGFAGPVTGVAVPMLAAAGVDATEVRLHPDWTTTDHRAPSVVSGGINARWVQIVTMPEWARSWTPPAGVTESTDVYVSGGQSITIGSIAVGAGDTGLGGEWTPADAVSPAGAVIANSVAFSILFRDGGSTGGSLPASAVFSGRIPTITVASVAGPASTVPVTAGATATAAVTVLGSDGLPFEGISVALTSGTTASVTVSASPQTTNGSGVATFTLNGVAVGISTLTANADSGAATATFSAAVSSGVSVAALVFGGVASVEAAGASTVQVTAIGTNGLPMAGVSVALTSSATGVATVTASPLVTNGSGVATFTLNGVAAGSTVLTASAASGAVTAMATAIVLTAAPPVGAADSGSAWGRWLRGR